MNSLLLMLCAFVALGMLPDRFRGFTHVAMPLMICAYVFYAYGHG